MSLVLDAVSDLNGAKITLVALADRANKSHRGESWPSLADIAARADKSERQARDDLRLLENRGWLLRPQHGGGRSRTTIYQLQIVNMLLALPSAKAEVHLRELRKLPGCIPPGFRLPEASIAGNCEQLNAAAHRMKPGSGAQIPGSTPPETRQSTAPELEVELESKSTGFEPEAHAGTRADDIPCKDAHPILRRLNIKQEKSPTLSAEEQIAYAKAKTGLAELPPLRSSRIANAG